MDIKNLTIGDILIILAVVASFYSFYKMLKELKKPQEEKEKLINDTIKSQSKINEDQEKRLTDLENKVAKVANSVTEMSNIICSYHTDHTNSLDMVKSSICSMQRQDLLLLCTSCLEKGFSTLEEKETISEQYQTYHKLGGNNFVTEMVDQVMSLPITKHRNEGE